MSTPTPTTPPYTPSPGVKLLGRDPLLWTALATQVLGALAVLGFGLSVGLAGAIDGVLIAAMAIYATRPRTPGVFTGAVVAGVALLGEFGVELEDPQVMALKGVTLAAFALVTRQQVEPQNTKISRA